MSICAEIIDWQVDGLMGGTGRFEYSVPQYYCFLFVCVDLAVDCECVIIPVHDNYNILRLRSSSLYWCVCVVIGADWASATLARQKTQLKCEINNGTGEKG